MNHKKIGLFHYLNKSPSRLALNPCWEPNNQIWGDSPTTHSATSTLTSIKSFESRKEIRALIKLPTAAMQTVDVSGRKLRKKAAQ